MKADLTTEKGIGKFKVELRDNRYNEPNEKTVSFTFNGYQWYGYGFTKEQAKKVVKVLQSWINE